MNSTKDNIAAAFLGLLEAKPIDKITVKDVVDVCGITRQTFYYHFEDIFDLLSYVVKIQEDYLLQQTGTTSDLREGLRIFISVFIENKKFFQNLMNSQNREQAERILLSAARSCLQKQATEKGLFSQLKYADMETALTFYTYALFGVLYESCRKKEVNEDLLADQLCRLIQGDMLSK